MKKSFALFLCAFASLFTALSCMHSDSDTNLSYQDSGQYYSMKAYFSRNKTKDVEEYMDRKIGRRSNFSFANTQSDATLTLDDHTTFHLKKFPGFIEIELDKNQNSDEAYLRVKSMCEGIKKILVK